MGRLFEFVHDRDGEVLRADCIAEEGDYRTNEIAINWNGALIYALAGFLEGASR